MFNLNLVTPEKKLVIGREVDEVVVPANKGELDILPGHAPLMTTLSDGVLRFKEKGSLEEQTVAISWGYCEVRPDGVHVLAETAELPEEIDKDRAKRALETSEAKLKSGLTVGESLKYQRKLRRARTRLETAEKH